ncbi:MAG: hypothetical protein J6Y68_03275, partial [Clostridia bacterium]|nr:hypothetical protein [Clostridia bacterium]
LGPVVTDYYGDMNGNTACDPYYEMLYGVYSGGADLCDGNVNSTYTQPVEDADKQIGKYGDVAWAIRRSAKRIMYYTLTSHKMNGMTSGTKIVSLTPWWQPLSIGLTIGFGAITVLVLGWAVVAEILERRK